MNLIEWVNVNFPSLNNAAKFLGINQQTLSSWCCLRRFPGIKNQKMIEEKTNGAVNIHAWKLAFNEEKKRRVRGNTEMTNENSEFSSVHHVVTELRKINRSVNLQSRKINRQMGLTGPQLVLMNAINNSEDELTIASLSKVINTSPPTATTIVDKLESKKLVKRVRNSLDRRKVHLYLTKNGLKALRNAPQAVPHSFVENFNQLKESERLLLISSLSKINEMIDQSELKVNAK